MKKTALFAFILFASAYLPAQYMIIGNDSISLADFKREYKYGLENNGIQKTIASMQDFLLLQQFAAEKKADTTASFRERMGEKEAQLRKEFFFPKSMSSSVLEQFMKDSQTELKVQIFLVRREEGDKTDYAKVYNDVKTGRLSMDSAIAKYAKADPLPLYIKPGAMENDMYRQLKALTPNSYTALRDNGSYVTFGKLLATRPTLGYVVFGTLSYPANETAEATKEKIYADLKSGKTFQEVAKIYGSTEQEKENGGMVMGSPTLPDEVYFMFKGQKAGYYTPEPVLFGDHYFIFTIYNVQPYALTDKNREFFYREMTNSFYAEILQDKLLAAIRSESSFREFPEFATAKKSFAAMSALKDVAVLYSYKGHKTTAGDLKKLIGDKKAEAEKMPPAAWSEALNAVQKQDLLRFYSTEFPNQKAIKDELTQFRKGLYSDYIFSTYLTEQIKKNPQWLAEYYEKHKSDYMWGKRAKGRVAILNDSSLAAALTKEIKDPKNWESLSKKYKERRDAKNQAAVIFEEGEMVENADIFIKNKVPFAPGVYSTSIDKRPVIIAIDSILPPGPMTQTEAAELLKDAVTEEKLQEIIAQQRQKTNIILQPGFLSGLEANFKK